jgi:hypothetical protein
MPQYTPNPAKKKKKEVEATHTQDFFTETL